MDKIAILAGNYEQYQDFMRQPEMGEPCEYIYFDHPSKAMGMHFFDYKIVGTFWERPDANQMINFITSQLASPPPTGEKK